MNQQHNPHEFPVPEQFRGQFQTGARDEGQDVGSKAAGSEGASAIDMARWAVAEAVGPDSLGGSTESMHQESGAKEVTPSSPEATVGRVYSIGQELDRLRNRMLEG